LKPLALWEGIGSLVVNPVTRPTSFAFPVLFAAFLFTSYLMLYALTHLQHPQLATGTTQPPIPPGRTPL
jgi:hypothetical protein